MIGAAVGQHTEKVCTCAMTSCLLLFSSAAANSKSMLDRLAFISSSCCWVMLSPSSYNNSICFSLMESLIVCLRRLIAFGKVSQPGFRLACDRRGGIEGDGAKLEPHPLLDQLLNHS